jgi:RHS repeat-associated protein
VPVFQKSSYDFEYDGLSRLKTANFSRLELNVKTNFSSGYGYNKNGNITSLYRYGLAGSNYDKIDNLTLSYNGNQLKKVSDTGVEVLTHPSDFKDYANATIEYEYNANGAMVKDLNKGITNITYNQLNLPVTLTISNSLVEATNEYTYTATGAKLQVIHRWTPASSVTPISGIALRLKPTSNTTTTDYVGNKIYENGVLSKILTDNGYYSQGKYYFYVRDHLGNNRVVADQNSNVVQSTDYYPFGMPYADGTGESVQPYKYSNKELDEMNGLNWYDFDARMLMTDVPVFPTPDPLAEKYYWMSPYAYCANNPVRYIDPDGKVIKLFNIVKYDNDGHPTMAIEGKVSQKTESTLKDLMKTSEVKAYFAQYAKKGDVVGGYTFTEDGKLSDMTLNFNDFSFSQETGNVTHLPGSGYNYMSEDKSTVDIGVVSYGVDKYSVGETLTHETQLHGYDDASNAKGKPVTDGYQDHTARKKQDTKHQGYKQYKSVQEQLQKIDERYRAAFEEAQREANLRY